MSDLANLDATAQAELVRSGQASAAELVDAAIARAEKLEPTLNAITTDRFERAQAEAKSDALPDGPLRGVPFMFKDLSCGYEGEPWHDGMQALKDADFRAPSTTALARRYRDAGLVVIARTNSPELGIMPTTEPLAYGPSHNPWDPTRTPGGSSGGSAAAVAAGVVPAAHASDGGGSIRIPASCCGLVGLKPSRGRVSVAPSGELARPLSVQFAVTHTVRDAALLLDVAAGPEPGDPIVAPLPAHPYRELVRDAPPTLRIGMMTTFPGRDTEVDAECVAAAKKTATLLEAAGHHVEVAHPETLDDPDGAAPFIAMWSAMAASNVARTGRNIGRELTESDVEPLTWFLAEQGRKVDGVALMDALFAMQGLSQRLAPWWEADGGFDLLLTPTLGELPPELGVLATHADPLAGFGRGGTFTPYTPWVQHHRPTGDQRARAPERVRACPWARTSLPRGAARTCSSRSPRSSKPRHPGRSVGPSCMPKP